MDDLSDDIGLESGSARDDVRLRIVAAASALLEQGGPDALTTRAVAAAAAVQAPTIYRLFGDKRGLLDAVAEHGLSAYMEGKAALTPHPDPVQDLRDGWDTHIAFGLAHPGIFAIMGGDPEPRPPSAAVATGIEVLRRRIARIALAGRLKVTERQAIDLFRSMGTGTILTLLRQAPAERDPTLSERAREAVISAIVTAIPVVDRSGPATAAITLRAALSSDTSLSVNERNLLAEWLDRLAAGPA